MNREYIWYFLNLSVKFSFILKRVKYDYMRCRGIFYLLIYLKVVNYGVGFKFLREFFFFCC